jgi:hypothetical protein
MRAVQDQIAPWVPQDFISLGADGFGFSDTRAAARRYFHIDGPSVVVRALQMLAKRGEIDAVVVGGGDGSVRTVASVLADTGVPLGVLPLGTLNHFARDLGIPLDVEAAAETIAKGDVRVVDLAKANGEIFINNASIGIYPYLVIARERQGRPGPRHRHLQDARGRDRRAVEPAAGGARRRGRDHADASALPLTAGRLARHRSRGNGLMAPTTIPPVRRLLSRRVITRVSTPDIELCKTTPCKVAWTGFGSEQRCASYF